MMSSISKNLLISLRISHIYRSHYLIMNLLDIISPSRDRMRFLISLYSSLNILYHGWKTPIVPHAPKANFPESRFWKAHFESRF